MQGEKNGLNEVRDISLSLKDSNFSISYSKGSNLIKALFMVTDIMDINEPLRAKLRAIGSDILSDIYNLFLHSNSISISIRHDKGHLESLINKTHQAMSFLDIGNSVYIISDMNFNILFREFSKLLESINAYKVQKYSDYEATNISDLFAEETPSQNEINNSIFAVKNIPPTRIGVQKGSTLLKALSDKMLTDGHKIHGHSHKAELVHSHNSKGHDFDKKNENIDFDLLKKQRRYEIVKVIKDSVNGASITDIVMKADGSLKSVSEKTLQRELVAMVADGVLKKSGSKRWSRYFLSK
jgi:hypothetical protein